MLWRRVFEISVCVKERCKVPPPPRRLLYRPCSVSGGHTPTSALSTQSTLWGCTVLYTLYILYTMYTLFTLSNAVNRVYTEYTVNTVYTMYTLFTINTIHTVFTQYTVCALYTLYTLFKICTLYTQYTLIHLYIKLIHCIPTSIRLSPLLALRSCTVFSSSAKALYTLNTVYAVFTL